MRLAWATDIHLDFITDPYNSKMSAKNLDIFCSFFQNDFEAVILSGDISLANFLKDHLLELEARLQVPIYFVLGNHDFWNSGFDEVRQQMFNLTNATKRLVYLSLTPYVQLSSTVAMVGHDGWYDGFNGNFENRNFIMNDWIKISNFAEVNSIIFDNNFQIPNFKNILMVARKQAIIATKHVLNGIKLAISQINPKKIIIVTHVPPFVHPLEHKENLYPWYSSKLMGDMLISVALKNPQIEFEVFCGHVHAAYEGNVSSNIFLRSGKAEYSNPRFQGVFNILTKSE